MTEYMDLETFAERAGLSYSMARRLCISGEVPGAIKWLSKWRIPTNVFEMKAQEVSK